MKSRKLIVIAAIVCLLVGASGAAMAQLDRNDCPDGSLIGEVLDEIVIRDSSSTVDCRVVGVYVRGRVLVDGARNFTMINSLVGGNVRVLSTVNATLADNTIEGGNLVGRFNTSSSFLRNIVVGGSLRTIGYLFGDTCPGFPEVDIVVGQNLVFNGNVAVICHDRADVAENKVRDGNITCRDNDKLDSKDNDAFGGRVSCSQFFGND